MKEFFENLNHQLHSWECTEGMVFSFSLRILPLKRGKTESEVALSLFDKDSWGMHCGEGTAGIAGCRDEQSLIFLL